MIRFAVARPSVVWASATAILLGGGVSLGRLSFVSRPAVEFPRLSVSASWPGVPSELMETYVTSPIEAAVQTIRGVRKTSSESSEGIASLVVTLDPSADLQFARLAILERLEALRVDSALPPTVSPTVSNFVPDEFREAPLLTLTVQGPYTPGALQRIVNEQVLPKIASIKGVGTANTTEVIAVGAIVEYDDALLRQIGVTPDAIADVLRNARIVESLGEQRFGASVRPVVLRDEPKALEELAALPLVARSGLTFRLGEVSTIVRDEDAQGNFSRINGTPAVTISLSREISADAIRTAASVRTLLSRFGPSLPAGLRFTVVSDESVRLRGQLRDIARRGLTALLAVILVLAVALRKTRAVALVMGSAVVAIAGTVLGLYVLGIRVNLLALAGLAMALGVLVQNGLIVVIRLGDAPASRAGRAEAASRILPAILGATLTTGVVLIPFLQLQGNARAAFAPFAAALSLALAWSIVAAGLMIPAIGTGPQSRARRWPRLRRTYMRLVAVSLRWRAITVSVTTVAFSVLAWAFYTKVPRTGWSVEWEQRPYVIVSVSFPRGSDPGATDRAIRDFENIVMDRPGVLQFRTRGNPTSAVMRVEFTDEAAVSAMPLVLLDELTQRGVLIGGANVSVSGFGAIFSSSSSGRSAAAFRIKVFGYAYRGVADIAADLETRLNQIPRVYDVRNNSASLWNNDRTVVATLTPDHEALARNGLTMNDLATAVAREISGAAGTGLRVEIGGEEMSLRLRSRSARNRTIDELREVGIPNGLNSPVRVGSVARIGEQEALSTITRDDQQYVRIVSYTFRGPSKLAQRTHKSFMSMVAAPPGYSVSDETFDVDEEKSHHWLPLVFALGIVLVILSVAIVFDSIWAACIVSISIPLALCGVMAAFWLAKATFTREAAVGVILVVGLAVNQAILMVDGVLQRRSEVSALGPVIIRAAVDRVGMITVVTLTSLASLMPFAVNTKATDLFGAIALAAVGGTIAGTTAALVSLPAVMLVASRRRASV